MSETEARAAKLHVGFPSLLKKSCLSENDPKTASRASSDPTASDRLLQVLVLPRFLSQHVIPAASKRSKPFAL